MINPGNPTGQVLSRNNIEQIIMLAHQHSVMILADEVYQNNIYSAHSKFISFRQVLKELGPPYADEVELISYHSVSKGLMGECGLRGGYMEVKNLPTAAEDNFYKLKSIELCSNTIGQLAVQLMVNPPTKGVESDACVEQYNQQVGAVREGLKERAKLLTETFNSMTNVSCTEIQGAMYAFPRVEFSKKFIEEAKAKGKSPDFLYCLEMVNKTGIMTVPGSGFGQKDGTYHFRITNLVTPTSKMAEVMDTLRKFNEEFHRTH